MRKLAIFVEGLTEQIFAERLLREVIGTKRLCIQMYKAYGGGRGQRKFRQLKASAPLSGQEYYVQIMDCATDERVKSDIKERYEGLVAADFCGIIGVRDVYPEVQHADIPKLRAALRYGLKTKPIEVAFVLGVMEIETWFIMEHTHFLRIDAGLTLARIKAGVAFDPSTDDVQLRLHPAKDLDHIYRLVGKWYTKTEGSIKRTVERLDYGRIYFELGDRLDDLRVFVAALNQFLS